MKEPYRLVPYAFAVICSMHFVLYLWLYQTPLYIVMAVLISLGATVVALATSDKQEHAAPTHICVLTGGLLLVTALIFLGIHLLSFR